MKVGIATDHNGVIQKQSIIKYLTGEGYEVIDYSKDNTPTDDYPDFAEIVAKKVLAKEVDFGILLCGTGIGMSIAANKIKGIRCGHVASNDQAFLARNHNDANIIALSYLENPDNLNEWIKTFLESPFSPDERHARRVGKINKLEEGL